MTVSLGEPQAVAPSSVNGPVSSAGLDGVEPASPKGSLVRTVCSWCPAVIVDVPADGPLSHGVCLPCFEAVLAA